jgi:hypothetical protein
LLDLFLEVKDQSVKAEGPFQISGWPVGAIRCSDWKTDAGVTTYDGKLILDAQPQRAFFV